MRRRLRVRLLVWSLVVLAVCVTVVHGIYTVQGYRNADTIRRQADRALERGKYGEALLCLSRYLTYAPHDVEALIKQIDIQDKLAQTLPAKARVFASLEQVLRRVPQREALRERAIALAWQLRRPDDAARHLKVLIAAQPTNAQLEQRLARCQIASRDYAKAAQTLRRAIDKDKALVASYAQLAELMKVRLDQSTEIVPLLNEMVEKNPQLASAFLLRARYYLSQQEAELASRDLDEALRLAPRDGEVLLAAAQRAQTKRQWEQARTLLERALQSQPEWVELYKALAAVEVQCRQRQAALTVLQRGLKRVPTSLELRYYWADLLIDVGDLPAAEKELARIRKSGGTLVAEYLRARLLQERRAWFEAAALFEELCERLEPLPAWQSQAELRLGRCYEELANPELEMAAYRRALARQPFASDARFGLARVLVRTGAVAAALPLLEKLSRVADAPPEFWAWWARALILSNAQLPANQRDWTEVERLLTQADLAAPGTVDVTLAHVEHHLARQQVAQAEAVLRLAQEQQPKEPLLWAALVDLSAQHHSWQVAHQTLTAARQAAGDNVTLRLALVRLWARRPPAQAVPALAELAKGPREPLTTAEQARWLHELAQTQFRLGGQAAAEKVWRQLAADQPNELRSRFVLFELAIKARDLKHAATLVADLRRIEGTSGLFWRACEAEMLITLSAPHDGAALAQARKRLEEVPEAQRSWPRLLWLLGLLAEREGRLQQGLDCYVRALEAGHVAPGLAARVLRLLHDQRRYEEAEQTLRYVDDATLLRDRGLRELAVRVALRRKNVQRALALAHRSGAAESRDYRDQLWLAQVYRATDQDREAIALLEQAVARSKTIPDVWVALVRQLVWSRDLVAAENVLAESQQQLPVARRAVVLARGYEALGEVDKAEKVYLELLRTQPDDFLVLEELATFYQQQEMWAKAEEMLRRLLAGATGAPEEAMISARRQLALVLAARGGQVAQKEALALLARNEQTLGKRVEDERARALVLAEPDVKSRVAQAVKRFEKTLDEGPLRPEERFQLARLYAVQGEVGKSNEWLRDLLGELESNARYLAYQVNQLIRQDSLDTAQFFLTRLERTAPRAPRTVQLRALLQKSRAALLQP